MVCLGCGAACHHYEIDPAESMLPQAETFSNQAFQAVAIGGLAYVSLGNRQPEARIRLAVAARQHDEPAVRGLARLLENPLEVGGRT